MSNRTVTVALKANTSGYDAPISASATKTRLLQLALSSASGSGVQDLGRMRASAGLLGGAFKASSVAAVGAGSAIAAAFTYGVGKAIEFDKQLRNVQSISKVSDQALGELGKQVLDLSKNLPQSAATLASGLYDVASSGFQGADGMKVLKAAAVSASAGMTDTATAAQAITAVLNAYGLSAGQAGDVSDELFQTVNLGVTTFEALAHNVGDYLGQAHALGLSFAETQSAIAALTLTGTTQMQAGTALGSVLNSLIRPQVGLAAAIKAIGYSSGTSAIQALGFRGVLMKLAEQTGGSAEAMGQLFTDSQALRSVLQLTSNDGKKWAEVAAQIEDPVKRAGAAQKALAEQSKSLSFQLQVAKNKLDAAAISVGEALLPTLAKGVALLVQFGQGTEHALEPLAPLLAVLWHAAQNLVNIGGDLLHIFGPVGGEFAKLAATPLVAVLYGLAKALEAVTGFLADNEALASALAIAYAIHLAGGISRVVEVLGTNLKVALAITRAEMAGATTTARGMGAALRSAFSAQTIGTAGIAAGIAVLLVQLHAASAGASSARQEFAALKKEVNFQPGDDKALAVLAQRATELQDAADHAAHGGNLLSDAWHIVSGRATEAAAASEEFHRKLADLSDTSEKAYYNTSQLMAGLHMTREEILKLAHAAGVKLDGDLNSVTKQLVAYYNGTVIAAPGTSKLSGAMDVLGDKAASADDQVKALSDALDELVGANIDAMKAEDNLAGSLADLTKSLHDNGKSFDVNTGKGRANRQALEDAGDAIVKHIESLAKQGVALDKLQPIYARDIAKLEKTATQAGLTKKQFALLLTQMGLTPDLVKTIVTQQGAQGVVTDLKNVQHNAALARKPVKVPIYLSGIDKVLYDLTHIPSPSVKVTVSGILDPLGLTHHASGGWVPGSGGPTADDQLIMASSREFVVNAADAQANAALLMAINSGAFRSGMPLMPSSAPTPAHNPLAGATFQITAVAAPGERAEHSVPRAIRNALFEKGLR